VGGPLKKKRQDTKGQIKKT